MAEFSIFLARLSGQHWLTASLTCDHIAGLKVLNLTFIGVDGNAINSVVVRLGAVPEAVAAVLAAVGINPRDFVAPVPHRYASLAREFGIRPDEIEP